MKNDMFITFGIAGVGLLVCLVAISIATADMAWRLKAGWFEDQVQGEEPTGGLNLLTSPESDEELFEVSHLAPVPPQDQVVLDEVYMAPDIAAADLPTVGPTFPESYTVTVTSIPGGINCTSHMAYASGATGVPSSFASRFAGAPTTIRYTGNCGPASFSGDFVLTASSSSSRIVPSEYGWECIPVDGPFGQRVAEAPGSWNVTVPLETGGRPVLCRWGFVALEEIPAPQPG